MLMVYGAQTPSRSRAEMEALASVPSIRTAMLPLGKLSVHEEFPDLVAETASRSSGIGPKLTADPTRAATPRQRSHP
jgi:hypothetical protein